MPADTGYGCTMVDGVVHVYTKKTNMDKYVSNVGLCMCISGLWLIRHIENTYAAPTDVIRYTHPLITMQCNSA